jgi:hypothetical protein
MTRPQSCILLALGAAVASMPSCDCDHDDSDDDTTWVGAFDGLFDGVATGFNFPLDIAIVPDDPHTDDVEGGDIYVANYGTSEVMRVPDPSGQASVGPAEAFFDGTSEGLSGATAVSIPEDGRIWAAFEQGGAGGNGAIVVLEQDGTVVDVLDGDDDPQAFANPGGLCWGGSADEDPLARAYMVNLGDGTAWRIEAADTAATDATFVRVGSGLATGQPGSPGSPGSGLSTAQDLPAGGARGCAYASGSLYVADAQNARIVRFDDADTDVDMDGVALEDTPPDLVTHPTDVAVNSDGFLIVISYDNAHAFVSLELPDGSFVDNGLHELNVNAGNYGVALAHQTIWFTRSNTQNGTLRAITPDPDEPPTTAGPFPPQ